MYWKTISFNFVVMPDYKNPTISNLVYQLSIKITIVLKQNKNYVTKFISRKIDSPVPSNKLQYRSLIINEQRLHIGHNAFVLTAVLYFSDSKKAISLRYSRVSPICEKHGEGI